MDKKRLRPGTVLGPLPAALVSLGTFDKPNIITVAWTGIVNSKPPMTYISVRPERYSHDVIKERREFVINVPTADLARRVDLCGMKTGRDTDKFKLCGFEKARSEVLNDCPVIADCPLNLECSVTDIINLGSHDMFIAEIKGVLADESLFDEKGRFDLLKGRGILGYVHGDYVSMGRRKGTFGFSVKKKWRGRK
ncbi:MAG: flavin reductase family protein [Clostridia bacterium]|nr:flavin reductase family protein [Clostridia bacterium]